MPVKPPKLGHVPALDGLRGMLFLVVLSAHLEPWPQVVGGQVVMATFFSLSGFLITALVVGEHQRTGRVSLRNFYVRRALRLLPALFAVLAVWLLVVLVFGSHGWISTVPGSSRGAAVSTNVGLEGVLAAVTYLTNWADVFHLFTGYVPLGHLWSLAVEEQFYVIWAPVLYLLLRFAGRLALPAVYAGAVLSLLEPLALWSHGGANRIYFGTDTRAGALLLGCVAGIHWTRGHLDFLRRKGSSLAIGTALALLLFSGFAMDLPAETPWYLGWVADAVGSALLVAAVVMRPRGLTGQTLSQRLMVYVGQRSYALYLWHYLFATWFNSLNLVGDALTVVCSFAAAEASWRLIESRALALKSVAAPDPARRDFSAPDLRTGHRRSMIPA